MSILEQLATSLGRKDEQPNIQLAQALAAAADHSGISQLVAVLEPHADKGLRHDSIKVLYEIGSIAPGLIAAQLPVFINLLAHKDNRMQWGAMTAIAAIVPAQPAAVFAALPLLAAAADRGSVITKDQYVYVLTGLAVLPGYYPQVKHLLREQLLYSLPNQLPMYAEMIWPLIEAVDRPGFEAVLRQRLPDLEKESKRKRIEKILAKGSRK